MQREKQALEASIDQAKNWLRDCTERCRALRIERAALVARDNSASAELDRLATFTPPTFDSHRAAESAMAPPNAPAAEPAQINRPWPPTGPTSSRSRRPSTLIPIFGGNAGIYARVDHPVRDICSYDQCCAISLSDVYAHVPAGRGVLGSKDVPQHIPQAIREHQAAVSTILSTPREDICWFVQMPHTVATGLALSHTASLASTPCQMALMVFGEALALEAGLLLEQHAGLVHESAADTSTSRPLATGDDADDTAAAEPGRSSCPPPLPEPDPLVCNQQLVRCGVNQTCTITEAIDGVTLPIIQRYRRKLPSSAWRSVCTKAMHKAVSAHGAVQRGARTHAAHASGEGGGGTPQCGSTGSCEGDRHGADSREALPGTGGTQHSTAQPRAQSESSAGSAVETATTSEEAGALEEAGAGACKAMCAIYALQAHTLWRELQADSADSADNPVRVCHPCVTLNTQPLSRCDCAWRCSASVVSVSRRKGTWRSLEVGAVMVCDAWRPCVVRAAVCWPGCHQR